MTQQSLVLHHQHPEEDTWTIQMHLKALCVVHRCLPVRAQRKLSVFGLLGLLTQLLPLTARKVPYFPHQRAAERRSDALDLLAFTVVPPAAAGRLAAAAVPVGIGSGLRACVSMWRHCESIRSHSGQRHRKRSSAQKRRSVHRCGLMQRCLFLLGVRADCGPLLGAGGRERNTWKDVLGK